MDAHPDPNRSSAYPPRPAGVVARHGAALLEACRHGPVLDVAAGDGRNGLWLAARGASALLADRSARSLALARDTARRLGAELGRDLNVAIVLMNLETDPPPLFAPASLGAVVALRYLHRPLIGVLREALRPGGLMVYETFLEGLVLPGGPRNPAHLLRRGELGGWFAGWEALESYEGPADDRYGEVGRLVCRKPR